MQRLVQIVAEDRIRKYSTGLIVKIIVILKIFGVFYRSSKHFLNNHKEFMELLNITDIPNFRTLSYRSLRIDWHYINSSIIDMINSYNDSAAVDSSIIKTCKDTTAQIRRKNGKYKGPESSWGSSTTGYDYGRRVHTSIDTDSLSVMEWNITTASVYDKTIALPIIDSVRNYNYILMDATYDSTDIYDYIFENTHALRLYTLTGEGEFVKIN